MEYFGFVLESDLETVEQFPVEHAAKARHILAAAVARGEARHLAVKKNRDAIEEIREAYKRSGGETRRLGLAELTALYEKQLADVGSMDEFRAARLTVDREQFVPRAVREKLERLPQQVRIRDREVDIDYDVEERDGQHRGVARLRLPEKVARSLTEEEIPPLDRPIRFVVLRGQRGAVRADTLEDLQELLAQPWSPDEVEESADDRAMLSHAEREVKRIAEDFRRHRRGDDRDGARHGSHRRHRDHSGDGSSARSGGRFRGRSHSRKRRPDR